MNSEKRIPSLDGLRAVAIALVFLNHSVEPASMDWTNAIRQVIGWNGDLGVNIFFVISGFLITTLLLREWVASARINLPKFYVRRAFRIMPAAYFYLGVILLLMCIGLIHLSFPLWSLSLIFLRNYRAALGFGGPEHWFTGHYWSLALEEQFYLVWPVCLAILGPTRAKWFAAGLIVVSPVTRILTYFAFPELRMSIGRMTHTRIDTIMFGCLAALLIETGALRKIVQRAAQARLQLVAIFWACIVSPLLIYRFQGFYLFVFGYSIDGACITFIMLWLIDRPASFAGRVLNNAAVVHLGVVSYGFYLWQQLFTPVGLPWSIALTGLAAEASYRLIEQPFLRLRNRVLTDGPAGLRPELVKTALPRLEQYRDAIISG